MGDAKPTRAQGVAKGAKEAESRGREAARLQEAGVITYREGIGTARKTIGEDSMCGGAAPKRKWRWRPVEGGLRSFIADNPDPFIHVAHADPSVERGETG